MPSLTLNLTMNQTKGERAKKAKKKKKSCPHNVENKSTSHTQQVIYSVVFFAFSLNLEHPVGIVNATRRE